MKAKIIFLIFTCFVFCGSSYSQETSTDMLIETCRLKVDEINNMELYKGYIMHSMPEENYFVSAAVDETEDTYYTSLNLYYDSQGRIRKYICHIREDYEVDRVMYFDENGDLCFQLYSSVDAGEYLTGKMYVYDSTILLFDGYVYYPNDNVDDPFIKFSFNDVKMPFSVNDYNFNIDNTSVILSIYGELDMPEDCRKVMFVAPEAGDVAMVSDNDVNIYQYPSTESASVSTVGIGAYVSVLAVETQEGAESVESNNWYRVRCESQEVYYDIHMGGIGYISGLFLEPVEKILN